MGFLIRERLSKRKYHPLASSLDLWSIREMYRRSDLERLSKEELDRTTNGRGRAEVAQ
jgi:hypothetical protein